MLLPHALLINGAYIGTNSFQMIAPIVIAGVISFWLRRLSTNEIEV